MVVVRWDESERGAEEEERKEVLERERERNQT